MEIEFDFREEKSKIYGTVLRPVATINLINNDKEVFESAYVDSGADVTLIPKSVGDALYFKIENNDIITEIKGIGEMGVPIVIKKIKIKIGEKIFNARIAWAQIEEVPLLLGREDVFNIFDICFKRNKKTVFVD